MGLFNSKISVKDAYLCLFFADHIGWVYHYFRDHKKQKFSRNSLDDAKSYGRFPYEFLDSFYHKLHIENLKMSRQQKQIVKQAAYLVTESLWDPKISEIKKCVEKFADYHKDIRKGETEEFSVEGQAKVTTGIKKDPAFKIFKNKLAEEGVSFPD